MKVGLAYGEGRLALDIPHPNVDCVEPVFEPGLADEQAALIAALRAPIGCRPLRELAGAGDRIGIVVCDVTRAMPSARVLPPLLAELAHVPDEQIRLFVALGTHRACTKDELRRMLGDEIVGRYAIVQVPADEAHGRPEQGPFVAVGRLRSGAPVRVLRAFVECDVKILTGFIEPHFFAGFSGGPKMVVPGLAYPPDVLHTFHNARVIGHPNAAFGVLAGNPVHEQIAEAAAMVPVDFNLNVTLNRDHAITGVFAGELNASHRQGCESVRRSAMRAVAAPFDIVVTTNSGYPLDLNFYQAVKGLAAAECVVKPGGAILLVAECRDGLPAGSPFARLLAEVDSPAALLELIQSPGFHRPEQWQAQILARIRQKADIFVHAGGLSPTDIRRAHCEPAPDLARTLAALIARYGPNARICALPEGPQTIPYLA